MSRIGGERFGRQLGFCGPGARFTCRQATGYGRSRMRSALPGLRLPSQLAATSNLCVGDAAPAADGRIHASARIPLADVLADSEELRRLRLEPHSWLQLFEEVDIPARLRKHTRLIMAIRRSQSRFIRFFPTRISSSLVTGLGNSSCDSAELIVAEQEGRRMPPLLRLTSSGSRDTGTCSAGCCRRGRSPS